MAPNMGQWIQAKHAPATARPDSPAAKGGFDDLKAAVPKTGGSRNKSKKSARSSAEDLKLKKHEDHPFIGDTDGSEADKTSTIGSIRQNDHIGIRSAYTNAVGGTPSQVYGARTAIDQRGGHMSTNYEGAANEAQYEAVWQQWEAEAQGKANPHSITQTYTKGDSYPTTTSGNMSEAEHLGRYDTLSSRGQHAVAPQSQPQPNQMPPALSSLTEGRQRQPLPKAPPGPIVPVTEGQQTRHTSKAVQPMLPKSMPPKEIPSEQREILRSDAEPLFTFGAPKSGNSSHARPAGQKHEPQQPAAGAIPQHTARAHRVRELFVAPAQPIVSFLPTAPATNLSQINRNSHAPRQGPLDPPYIPSSQHGSTYLDPSEYEGGNVFEQDNANVNGVQEDEAEPTQHQDGPEDQFDYPVEDIYSRSYKSLAEEDFDVDPKVQPFQHPDLEANATLADQVARALGYDAEDRMGFFASLNLTEWEEAGDWFLDQFADVVKKLKSARQEKREAARNFEREIKERHAAVGKKRLATEDALTEMRQNGAAILAGTPKKRSKRSK